MELRSRLCSSPQLEPGARPTAWPAWLAFLLAMGVCRGGDPVAGWQEVTHEAPWAARDGHTCAVLQEKLWILGGREAGGPTHRNDVWSSPNGADWSPAAAAAPWRARCHHASVVFKGRVWILGGLAYDEVAKRNVYLKDVWSSSDGVAWTAAKAAVPWPERCHHAAVVCQERIWVMGGENGGGENRLSDVWSTDDGEHWIQAANAAPWGGRSYHASTVHKDQLWILGGLCPGPGGRFRNDVWSSTDGAHWTPITTEAGWKPRMGAAAASWDGQLWLLGGAVSSASSGPQNDLWRSADGKTWQEVVPSTRWPRRAEHAVVVFADSIWLLGGSNYRARLSYHDVWRLGAGQ